MKRAVFIAVLFVMLFGNAAKAQENVTFTKEQQKELSEKLDSIMFVQGVQAIKDKQFTLEADRIISKRGRTAYVSSNTNFVMIEGEKAVVQVAFSNSASGGPNGLGGITVEGSISSYEIKESKKGNITLTLNVTGIGISARLNIYMTKGSNRATVEISPNFNSNRTTLSGILLPNDQSLVFKGTSL